MWIRRRFDIRWRDLLHAAFACVQPNSNADRQIIDSIAHIGHAEVFLSVRSAFDALLTSLNLDEGDEVLMSALTVDGMVRVVEAHGLVPVPVDIETDTLMPTVATLQNALSSRSKVLVLAHLFGNEHDVSPLIRLAQAHGILTIDDKAQAFRGTKAMNFQADVAFYSFGTIKTATALGGGIALAKDSDLIKNMTDLQRSYPIQSSTSYLNRVLKYGSFKLLMYRWSFQCVVWLLGLLGIDYDRVVKQSARGFREDELLLQLRHRTSAGLSSTLKRRLSNFSTRSQEESTKRGDQLRNRLKDTFPVPGNGSTTRGYWVLPICTDFPDATVNLLRDAGLDGSTRGSLVVVQPPAHQIDVAPLKAQHLLEHIVFLPFYSELPDRTLARMVDVLTRDSRSRHQKVTT